MSVFSRIWAGNKEDPEAQLKDKDTAEAPPANPMTPSSFWESAVRTDAPIANPATAETYGGGCFGGTLARVDNFFRVTDRGSSLLTEFCGGFTTFFSMVYIFWLNSAMLRFTGITANASFFATAISSGGFTLMMGLLANVPIALGPSVALQSYFASIATTCTGINDNGSINGTACPSWGTLTLPWSDAMGAIFLSGWIYLFFTFTGLRSMMHQAVPPSLRAAIAVGTGFYLTMVGLKMGQITSVVIPGWALPNIYADGNCVGGTCNPVSLDYRTYDNTIVDFNKNPSARIAILSIVFVTAFEIFKLRGAIILSICAATLIGINYSQCDSLDTAWLHTYFRNGYEGCVTNLAMWNQKPNKIPWIIDISSINSGEMTFKYADSDIFWEAVWTFLFIQLFDSFGTITGVLSRCGSLINDDPDRFMSRVNRAMMIDGWGLWLGAIIGSNSVTCFIESNTGVEAGARTGFASVITGSLFFMCLLWVYPFVSVIPDCATTGALVMVGVYSLQTVRFINFEDPIDLITAFFTVATMGFTYSIANGICAGFIFFSWMRTVRWVQTKVCSCLNKPAWGPKEGLETDLPHPLMVTMAVFMAFRFKYLGA